MLRLRAPWITPSSTVKSNFPCCGSIWFQETPGKRVLSLAAASLGHTVFMYSRLVGLRLNNSPASAWNGLPSTISWVAVPCFRRCGRSDAEDADLVETGLLWL